MMDLPHEDLGDECKRIQAREQSEASLRDEIKRIYGENGDAL